MSKSAPDSVDEIDIEFYIVRTNSGKHIEIVMDSDFALSADEYISALKEFLKIFEEKPERIFDCDPPFSGMN